MFLFFFSIECVFSSLSSKTIESLTKELNIVDQDLKQMRKRQRCLPSSVNISTEIDSKRIIEDNPMLLSNSTMTMKEELSSTSSETMIINDTVPNWRQAGGQVRLVFDIRCFSLPIEEWIFLSRSNRSSRHLSLLDK